MIGLPQLFQSCDLIGEFFEFLVLTDKNTQRVSERVDELTHPERLVVESLNPQRSKHSFNAMFKL